MLQFFRAGKVTSAVCHGPAAIVGATAADGSPIVKGKRVVCFTDAEEEAVKAVDTIPFLVESRIRELGGQFVNADLWAVRCYILSYMRTILTCLKLAQGRRFW